MEWQPIDTAPKDGTHILVCYFKGGKKNWRTIVSDAWITTEAYYVPKHYAAWDTDKVYAYGDEWRDGLGRLIQDCKAKASTSQVGYWMPLPEPPKFGQGMGED